MIHITLERQKNIKKNFRKISILDHLWASLYLEIKRHKTHDGGCQHNI